MEKYIDRNLKQYLADLSDKKIVPGGGSASALVAALGAGLNLMVINFCMNRKNCDETVLREMKEIKNQQQECLDRLSALIDEDCKVFTNLMKVLSEKKDIQKAYQEAAAVPLEICRETVNAIEISLKLVDKTGKHIVSDVGCSVNFLESAFSSAKINVAINLKYIEDKDIVAKYGSELDSLGSKIDKAKETIVKKLLF